MPEDTSSTRIDEASDSLNTGKFYILLLFVSLIGIHRRPHDDGVCFPPGLPDCPPVERHSC